MGNNIRIGTVSPAQDGRICPICGSEIFIMAPDWIGEEEIIWCSNGECKNVKGFKYETEKVIIKHKKKKKTIIAYCAFNSYNAPLLGTICKLRHRTLLLALGDESKRWDKAEITDLDKKNWEDMEKLGWSIKKIKIEVI